MTIGNLIDFVANTEIMWIITPAFLALMVLVIVSICGWRPIGYFMGVLFACSGLWGPFYIASLFPLTPSGPAHWWEVPLVFTLIAVAISQWIIAYRFFAANYKHPD